MLRYRKRATPRFRTTPEADPKRRAALDTPENQLLAMYPSAAASSAGQAITRSGIITVPFVSGDTSKAQAKLSAPKHVPIIIGMAKPKS